MITSLSNQQVKNVVKLRTKGKERRQQRRFVAEGIRMVLETPKEHLQQIYLSQEFLEHPGHRQAVEQYFGTDLSDLPHEEMRTIGSTELLAVSGEVMKHMSDTVTPQGILAVISMPEYAMDDLLCGEDTHLLILENLQDPGNLGTMFRTGEGAGISGIIMSADTVDVFMPKVIRSTMGAIFRVPFLVVKDLPETLQEVKSKGVKLYAAHLKGQEMYDAFDYGQATGFLVGNEGNGLTEEIANLADQYIRIPMGGALESLNAAMAAGILMYEVNRQRRSK